MARRQRGEAGSRKGLQTSPRRRGVDAARPRVGKAQIRRRFRRHRDPRGIWWPRRHAPAADHLSAGRGELRDATAGLQYQPRHGGAGPPGLRHGRAEKAFRAGDALRRPSLVSAILRAGGGVRSCRAAHTCGEGRRRMGRERPEDLELGRAVRGLRHPGHPQRSQRPEAQGSDLLLRRHEVARHRGAPDQADAGLLELQRSLHDGPSDTGFATSGRCRRRMAGCDHHADERAPRVRCAAGAEFRGRPRIGADARAGGRPRPSPMHRCGRNLSTGISNREASN